MKGYVTFLREFSITPLSSLKEKYSTYCTIKIFVSQIVTLLLN